MHLVAIKRKRTILKLDKHSITNKIKRRFETIIQVCWVIIKKWGEGTKSCIENGGSPFVSTGLDSVTDQFFTLQPVY